MNRSVCVDASLAAKWVLPEEHREKALALVAEWERNSVEVIAPPLLPIEVTNAIRKRVFRGEISHEQAKRLLQTFSRFQVTLYVPDDLYEEALSVAQEFNRPTVYDSHYVALAKLFSCELWTADKRFYNAVSSKLSWVKWIGDYHP